MYSVALWLSGNLNERVERRAVRNAVNIASLSDKSFVQNFRLSKEAFNYVMDNIKDELPSPKRSTAVSPEIKLATMLKFLGQGGYQHQIGQDRFSGVAQQTVSNYISEVCGAIEKMLCPRHINFNMTDEEKRSAKNYFYVKCGIPGIIGAVDGTHIQMVRPSNDEHLFFNRKLKQSINAMVICDHKMQIRAVNGCYGGASHDSHVWHLSDEREFLKANYLNGDKSTWIIGDSGFPLEPWILTPYRSSSENSPESRFNDRFSKARSIIKRVFGILKARFRCLLSARELHYSPDKVVTILNVCCALHNICIQFNVQPPQDAEINYQDDQQPYTIASGGENGREYARIAQTLRDQIKNNFN